MSLFNAGRIESRDINGIHNPFENPSVPLTSLGLDNVFGAMNRNDSGESITVDSGLTIATFWRCIGLMSTVVAGCPIRAYKTEGKKEIFPDILSVGNGDMRYTQFELWELVVAHLMLWGNAYVLKWRDPLSGPPGFRPIADLRPIDPSRVNPKVDDQGNKIFEIIRIDKEGNLQTNKPPITLTTFEIMHIPGFGYNGITGLSPIEKFARTLGTSIASDRLAARFFSKGTLLSGIINVRAPLADQTQADAIRNRWIARSGGVANAAEVAVLDAETSFQPLTIAPEALQFLESRRWETTEIARMFGIPPHLVGDVEKTTSWGTGIEQQNIAFASYTVSGYTNRIEQRMSREVIPMSTQFCEFDLNRLMRGSMQERFNAYATAITAGWMTRNEARLLENDVALPGLDEPLMPPNTQTVKQANDAAAKALKAPTAPSLGQGFGSGPSPNGSNGSNANPGPTAGSSVGANETNTGKSSTKH